MPGVVKLTPRDYEDAKPRRAVWSISARRLTPRRKPASNAARATTTGGGTFGGSCALPVRASVLADRKLGLGAAAAALEDVEGVYGVGAGRRQRAGGRVRVRNAAGLAGEAQLRPRTGPDRPQSCSSTGTGTVGC